MLLTLSALLPVDSVRRSSRIQNRGVTRRVRKEEGEEEGEDVFHVPKGDPKKM